MAMWDNKNDAEEHPTETDPNPWGTEGSLNLSPGSMRKAHERVDAWKHPCAILSVVDDDVKVEKDKYGQGRHAYHLKVRYYLPSRDVEGEWIITSPRVWDEVCAIMRNLKGLRHTTKIIRWKLGTGRETRYHLKVCTGLQDQTAYDIAKYCNQATQLMDLCTIDDVEGAWF